MITINANGCQTEIAEKIVNEGADYCLAVKDNQPKTKKEIADHFDKLIEADFKEEDGSKAKVRTISTDEKGHGRIEHRSYYICPVPLYMSCAGDNDDCRTLERYQGDWYGY